MYLRSRYGALLGASILVVLWSAPAVEAGPRRIVSLAPSVTETLFALGAGEDVVGVTDFCDWPPPARKIDRVGSYLRPNVEAIVAHEPDLVIAVPTPGNHEGVELLGKLGLSVLVVSEGPKLGDVLDSIRAIARETGRSEAATPLIRAVEAEIAAVETRLAGRARRRVLVVVDHEPLVAAGEGTLIEDLLRLAGGTNAASGLGLWPRLSLEHVIRSNPEVIVDTSMTEGPGALSFYEGLGLRALSEKRIHAVRIDEILRPGPRISAGVETLARLVHPEVFGEK